MLPCDCDTLKYSAEYGCRIVSRFDVSESHGCIYNFIILADGTHNLVEGPNDALGLWTALLMRRYGR